MDARLENLCKNSSAKLVCLHSITETDFFKENDLIAFLLLLLPKEFSPPTYIVFPVFLINL